MAAFDEPGVDLPARCQHDVGVCLFGVVEADTVRPDQIARRERAGTGDVERDGAGKLLIGEPGQHQRAAQIKRVGQLQGVERHWRCACRFGHALELVAAHLPQRLAAVGLLQANGQRRRERACHGGARQGFARAPQLRAEAPKVDAEEAVGRKGCRR